MPSFLLIFHHFLPIFLSLLSLFQYFQTPLTPSFLFLSSFHSLMSTSPFRFTHKTIRMSNFFSCSSYFYRYGFPTDE